MSSSSKSRKLLAYFGVPVAFCLAGYLLLWVAIQPIWGYAAATMAFLVSDNAPAFNTNLSTTYDPDAQKNVATANPDAQQNSVTTTTDAVTMEPIDGRDVTFPISGENYGVVQCEEIGLDAPVYWYDTDDILLYGAGQPLISSLPGFGGPIILAGHNTTFFKCLQDASVGDVIHFKTNYCNYEYTVNNIQVYDEEDLNDLLLDKSRNEKEELILYTCYPFHAINGRKYQRYVIFADRTAGRDVQWREEELVER